MRGGLGSVIRLADEIANTQLHSLVTLLDEMSDVDGSPFEGLGSVVPRADFRTLLAYDEPTQRRTLALLPYMTEREKDALARELQRAMPSPDEIPPEVTTPPMNPMERNHVMRRSTGYAA